jgi:hypothetical protein
LLLATLQKKKIEPVNLSKAVNRILTDAKTLGLPVTRDQLGMMMLEFVETNPKSASLTAEGYIHIKSESINTERFCHHIESVYSILKSELSSISFRAIPREKANYTDPQWLADSVLFSKYPDTVDEFQRAGRCFAYGENTACIFHLMRVTDFCFRKVADSLQIHYSAHNWHGIGQEIARKMEQKYQTKTDAWKSNEPFYAEILADIQAIGRAHRNPALHELEKKYDERETAYMLTMIEAFAKHVAVEL